MQIFKTRATGSPAPNSTPSKPVAQYGINKLVDPDHATIDIVFVHGLTGGQEKTWTHADGTTWPQDLLAEDFPTARIMAFGYDADVAKLLGHASTNTVRDHGRTLCTDLAMARLTSNSNDRPLIFIVHSLGGLVCEQALLISAFAPEAYYQNILECTVGIVFFGTPHAGSDVTRWAPLLTNLARLATSVNRDITDVLEPRSQVLAGLQQEFHRLLARRAVDMKSTLKMFCIYEELPVTGVGMIVDRQSAILQQYDCIGIHGNHLEIVKFGKDKAGYNRVKDRLWVWLNVENGEQSVRANLSQREALGSQGYLSIPIYQLRQPKSSNVKLTQERIISLVDLTWQLYAGCDEVHDLKPLCPELGILNLQFRKAKEHLALGAIDRALQDMLLNAADGCHMVLTSIDRQIRQYERLEGSNAEEWNQVIWNSEQIRRQAVSLSTYSQGLSAINTTFSSEAKLLVVKKFLSLVQDVRTGKAEWSALSQNVEYVTADDGETEIVWRTLRHDLECTGVSTQIIDKHRTLITNKFKELVESGQFEASERREDGSAMEVDSVEEYGTAPSTYSDEDIDIGDIDGSWTIPDISRLFYAASSGRVQGVLTLIKLGIDVNSQDANGKTALHHAALCGQKGIVDILLNGGCDVTTQDTEGLTPLTEAVTHGHHSVLRAILSHSSGPSAVKQRLGYAENTILHIAASTGDEDAMLLLLNSGADANTQNRAGQTALHLAAWRRNLVILTYLLDADSTDASSEDFWGDTALDVALGSPTSSTDRAAVIRIFVEASRADRDGKEGNLFQLVDLEDVVGFLNMESIYDRRSEENIFRASRDGTSMSLLLTRQLEMNNLADDLFEAIY